MDDMNDVDAWGTWGSIYNIRPAKVRDVSQFTTILMANIKCPIGARNMLQGFHRCVQMLGLPMDRLFLG